MSAAFPSFDVAGLEGHPAMKLAAVIRSLGTTLALFACAAVAFAGSGTSLEEPAHTRVTAPPTHASATPRANATDDGSAGSPRVVARSSHAPAGSPRPAEFAPVAPRPTQAPASDRRTDKHDHGRATPTTSVHAHRPLAQRSKGSLRNTPATPGMGLLLRMGTSMGRELSFFQDDVSNGVSSLRSGRAPPRASPCPALARDPIACAPAALPPLVTPTFHFAAVTPPTPDFDTAFRPNARSRAGVFSRVRTATACRTGSLDAFPMEPFPGSRAPRWKGACA